MYRTITEFLEDWKGEAALTQKLLDRLADESLAQSVAPGHRTLGRLAWHIVGTIHEMMTHAGLRFSAPGEEGPVPASAREIAEAYGRASAAFTEALRQQWTDATLSETRNMYGQVWTGAEVLSSLVRHQIHHRGQMTVLMRQAGLGVPGVYGPSKDEWAAMGMPAPEV